ncbi:MAG: hypothetical protein JKY84_02455 [Emcibacteraceae bacterium]|nr:hypothetical protein [Emcibacteraceae bacterium]
MKEGYVDRFTVRTVRDKKTKNIIGEYWNLEGGPPHRTFGPAYSEYHPVTGKPLKEAYYTMGAVHRPENEGPSTRIWSPETGKLIYEAYCEYGSFHRSGGKPAIIYYDAYTSEITKTEHYFLGQLEKEIDHGPNITP